jgi:hypothetical protein
VIRKNQKIDFIDMKELSSFLAFFYFYVKENAEKKCGILLENGCVYYKIIFLL